MPGLHQQEDRKTVTHLILSTCAAEGSQMTHSYERIFSNEKEQTDTYNNRSKSQKHYAQSFIKFHDRQI